jgi:nitric oxide reductase subunit C
MKRNVILVLVFVALAALLAACGNGGGGAAAPAAPAGNVDAGKALFAQSAIGSQAGCATCHSLEAGQVLVGPSMAGIGTRAGSTVSGQSAEQYITNSIVDPNAHLVEGFAQGIMQSYKDAVSEQQLKDLTAYLLTLK